MKQVYSMILMLIVLLACSSPEKLLQKGNYDALIDKSIKKIIKDPNSSEDVELLDKAYKLANQQDIERINYLKLENNPNSWDEVLSLYARLKDRQTKVRKVLPLKLHGRTINYEFVDYDREMVEAKRKAAEYFYTHGKSLMQNNSKESFRQAYYELNKANNYSGGAYPDIDQLITEARFNGTSRVLVSAINNSQLRLPQDFMENLLALNSTGLNSEWVEYHFRPLDENIDFDFYVDINLQIIDVSPEIVRDSDRQFKKKVEDGFNYALDARGNVMKDSTGNDIKIPKYKELSCTVIDKTQEKSVTLKGEVETISSNPKRVISKDPISATTQFRHVSARAVGDLDALDTETRKLVETKEIPFPDDMTMVYDTSEGLKQAIMDVIRRNRQYIR